MLDEQSISNCAEDIKNNYGYLDIIINATSIGLNNDNGIKLDNLKNPSGKLFYDLIYNPSKTQFLLDGEKSGALVENGKLMFIYQA